MKKITVEKLNIEIHPTREQMGNAAADAVADKMRSLIQQQGSIRMIFASAPSQNEFLKHLKKAPDIDWSQVTALLR